MSPIGTNLFFTFSLDFQVLLELAKVLFEEQSTLSSIVRRIMELTISLMRCERCSVLVVDEMSKVRADIICCVHPVCSMHIVSVKLEKVV